MKDFKWIRFFLLAVFIPFIAFNIAACELIPEEEASTSPALLQPKRQEYKLQKAERKDIEKYIKGTGVLQSVNQKQLFFTTGGKRLAGVNVKNGQRVEKGTSLIKTQKGDIDSRIRIQQIDVEKMQIQLDELKKQYNTEISLPAELRIAKTNIADIETKIKLQELELEKAKIQLADLLKERSDCELTAPVSGIVTYVTNLNEGDVIEAFKTLVTISGMDNLQVLYNSEGVQSIKAGMPVKVTYDSKSYNGEVVLTPDNVPSDADDSTKKGVIIKVKGLPADARIGSSVAISVLVQSSKNTIVLPLSGIQRLFGASVVMVMDGDSKKEVNVETGIETATEIEIVKGLEEGQMVIIN